MNTFKEFSGKQWGAIAGIVVLAIGMTLFVPWAWVWMRGGFALVVPPTGPITQESFGIETKPPAPYRRTANGAIRDIILPDDRPAELYIQGHDGAIMRVRTSKYPLKADESEFAD